MDIEKMIEQLSARGLSNGSSLGYHSGLFDEAATALSTLQGENKQLRGELEYEQEHANAYHEECGQWEAENEKLRAELERVKRERDAAIGDIYSGNANDCDTCLHGCDYNNDCPLETGGECKYKWRGLQREN